MNTYITFFWISTCNYLYFKNFIHFTLEGIGFFCIQCHHEESVDVNNTRIFFILPQIDENIFLTFNVVFFFASAFVYTFNFLSYQAAFLHLIEDEDENLFVYIFSDA